MSPRVFDGHAVEEVHEHFDAAGKKTGHTLITRESEWDESSRQRATELHRYEKGLCGCGCGRPVKESYNPEQVYKVDHFTCMAGRALAIAKRMAAEQAKKDNNGELPEGWDDGRHYYAEPVEVNSADRAHSPRSPQG